MRTAALAAALVLLFSLIPGASPLPTPGQNDAGSGTDAPDFHEAYLPALPITPGAYQGNLTLWAGDATDAYRIYPPPKSVVRVTIRTPEFDANSCLPLRMALVTKYGENDIRMCRGPDAEPVVNASIVSGGGEPVTLWFDNSAYFDPTGHQTYWFSVTVETHEHIRALEGGPDAAAWAVHFLEDQWGMVDAYHPPGADDIDSEHDVFFSRFLVASPESCRWINHFGGIGGFWGSHLGRSGLYDGSVVWTHGTPYDVHVGNPVPPEPAVPATDIGTDSAESLEGNLTVYIGDAWNGGALGLLGWVIWDGPIGPIIENRTAKGTWLTLEDFDEGGLAFQVGPYAEAWNVSASRSLRHDVASSLVVADGTTPKTSGHSDATGRRQTIMNVTLPNGTFVTLEDSVAGWATPGLTRLVDGPAPPGEWTFRVRQLSGGESDHVRVAMMEWDIPATCDAAELDAQWTDPTSGGEGASDEPPTPEAVCKLGCAVHHSVAGLKTLVVRTVVQPAVALAKGAIVAVQSLVTATT